MPQDPRACRALYKQGLGKMNLSEKFVSEEAPDLAAQAPCAAATGRCCVLPPTHFCCR